MARSASTTAQATGPSGGAGDGATEGDEVDGCGWAGERGRPSENGVSRGEGRRRVTSDALLGNPSRPAFSRDNRSSPPSPSPSSPPPLFLLFRPPAPPPGGLSGRGDSSTPAQGPRIQESSQPINAPLHAWPSAAAFAACACTYLLLLPPSPRNHTKGRVGPTAVALLAVQGLLHEQLRLRQHVVQEGQAVAAVQQDVRPRSQSCEGHRGSTRRRRRLRDLGEKQS